MEQIHPAFFAQFWYDQLDYKFPLNDFQPVVRIPVSGPAPFNTLAVMRTIAPGTLEYATGDLRRDTFSVLTPLFLRGYDPLRPEQQQVQHSSTAFLRMMQICEHDAPHIGDWNTEFTIALDRVHSESRISPQGQWIMTFDAATQVAGRLASWQFQISSWVLFWEPPQNDSPPAPDVVQALGRIGVDFSVPESDLREWLANPQFTPYPAISQALLLMQRGLIAPTFVDVIVSNYEHTSGVESPRNLADVRIDILKTAILDGFNERHGTNLTNPEDVFQTP